MSEPGCVCIAYMHTDIHAIYIITITMNEIETFSWTPWQSAVAPSSWTTQNVFWWVTLYGNITVLIRNKTCLLDFSFIAFTGVYHKFKIPQMT